MTDPMRSAETGAIQSNACKVLTGRIEGDEAAGIECLRPVNGRGRLKLVRILERSRSTAPCRRGRDTVEIGMDDLQYTRKHCWLPGDGEGLPYPKSSLPEVHPSKPDTLHGPGLVGENKDKPGFAAKPHHPERPHFSHNGIVAPDISLLRFRSCGGEEPSLLREAAQLRDGDNGGTVEIAARDVEKEVEDSADADALQRGGLLGADALDELNGQ